MNVLLALVLAMSGAADRGPPDAENPQLRNVPPVGHVQFQPNVMLLRYFHCMAYENEAEVKAVLTSSDPNASSKNASRLLRNNRCANYANAGDGGVQPIELKKRQLQIRGYAAEVLLGKHRAAVAGLQAQAVEKSYDRPWFNATGRLRAVNELAVCVAATNPSGVQALFATGVDTKAQATAFGVLQPSIQTCLPAKMTLKSDMMGLRGAFAEALWRRASQDGVL